MAVDYNKTTILIIDNDEPGRLFIVSELNRKGFLTYTANGCIRAISKAIAVKPEIILLATMNKSKTGLEIGHSLSSNIETKGIPIIYLSEPNETVNYDLIFRNGGVDIVSKPINISELNARIEFQLNHKRRKTELYDEVNERDKLFTILSHDLRKPFASLMGMTQLLAESTQFCSFDELRDLANENHKTVKNTYNLLENLLEWCKVKSNQVLYKPEKLNLYDLINDVAYNFKDYAREKNVELNLRISTRANVFADEKMIFTVMKNLTDNAIKFSKPNSEIFVRQKDISIGESVTVEDFGVGIKNSDLPKLFNISSPFSTPGTANERGGGLGLILSKELIKKNGGNFTFTSKYNSGSSFTFELPKIAV